MNRCVFILGVRIDAVTLLEARDRIVNFLHSGLQHHIMTPNPEMIVRAHHDPAMKKLLNATSFNVPDGVGLLWAARRHGESLPERVAGVDLLSAVCALPDCPSIFLLGAAPGVAEKAAVMLRQKNPSLQIAGTYAGSPSPFEDDNIVSLITASKAQMIFVAYGAPLQDFWIQRNLTKLPMVRVAMGVGGAFDFLAGVSHRAPQILQRIGLEWLWRLVQEPWRLRRIFTAVVVFPYLVITQGQSRLE